jgi:arylsulfatase
VSGALAAGFDLYATFASVAGAELPANRIIDGIDLTPLLTGASEASGRDTFYYYANYKLMAVRKGDMKLVLPGPPGPGEEKAMLYDVNADPGETADLAAERPTVVAELQQLAEQARKDLGDGPKRPGKNRRPAADLKPPE